MAKIIDGKKIASEIRTCVANEVINLKNKGKDVKLCVIIVGNDPASRIYVNNKKKACLDARINFNEFAMPDNTSEEELINLIDKLNADDTVDGILVQLPLPKHIDEKSIIKKIDPKKDVDAFCEANVGKIMIGDYDLLPATPAGVIEILKHENIDITGKHCVVVGRSNIVGKPMAMLLLHNNATVTICHSKTTNLKEICSNADILISAVGKANFIKKDMVKNGAVVIDVGINRDENNKLCGDIDFDEVSKICSYITPVPGGVGPMTIAMLLKNTLTCAKIKMASK